MQEKTNSDRLHAHYKEPMGHKAIGASSQQRKMLKVFEEVIYVGEL